MPYNCWNKITIKATTEQITQIITTEFITTKPEHFQHFLQGKEVYIFRIHTENNPNKDFMNHLFEKYEGIWIKNIWQSEDGMCGIIVGTKGDLNEISWDEGSEEEWTSRLEDVEFPDVVLAKEFDEDDENDED